MSIHTYGKIILENGQKVFKRFGAAAKEKINLGTAAFSDTANNLTTTEEGFLLDARQGKQLYEYNLQLSEQISLINSKLSSKFYFYTVPYNKQAKIKPSGPYAMIITVNATVSSGFLTIIAQGYGPGAIRNHVSVILNGSYFSYEILEDELAIMITNEAGDRTYDISIFMISGSLQSVELL